MKNDKDTINFLEKEGYEFIKLEKVKKENGRTEKRLTIKHLLCGKEYECRYERFFNEGQRCSCLRKRTNSKISSTVEYQSFLNKTYGYNEYTLLTEYLGRKRGITLKHRCGHEYTIKRAEFLIDGDGGTCPMCTKGNRNTEETLLNRMKNEGLDATLLEPFETGKTKYLIRNNKCNHEYIIRTYDVLTRKKVHCMICENKSPKNIDIERVKDEFLKLDDKYDILDTVYNGTHSPILVRHKECGHTYKVSRTNFLNGRRCPKCSKGKGYSYKEEELFSFINSIIPAIANYKVLNEDTGGFPEIDIFIPSKNIGIEFDGLFWHSTERKSEFNLLDKTEFFKSRGISIIHIFEDEWDNNKDIIKEKLIRLINDDVDIDDENTVIIDRCWFVNDKYLLSAGYVLDKVIPPREFFLTNLCDKRYDKKTSDTKFSIFDCGYYIYKKK